MQRVNDILWQYFNKRDGFLSVLYSKIEKQCKIKGNMLLAQKILCYKKVYIHSMSFPTLILN